MAKLFTLCFVLFSFGIWAQSAKIPTAFEENKGQFKYSDGKLNTQALFRTNIGNTDIYFYEDKISYYFKEVISKPNITKNVEQLSKEEYQKYAAEFKIKSFRMDLEFVGALKPEFKAEKALEFKKKYYLGGSSKAIVSNNYETITYEKLYQNIDFKFYTTNSGLKYDIIVHPGASLADVKLFYNGAENIKFENSELIVSTEMGELKESVPFSYFTSNPDQNIDVQFVLNGDQISFTTRANITETLVIDPVIVWSTYYNYDDATIWGQELDARGSTVASLSLTSDASMPTQNVGTSAYFQPVLAGMTDLRLLVFNTNGILKWATYLGGSGAEEVRGGIKIDANENIFVAASTSSSDFPLLDPGASAHFDNTTNGQNQIVILKFNTSAELEWSTLYTGSVRAYAYDIALDANNNVYVVGDNDFGYTISTQNDPGAYFQGAPSANYPTDKDGIILKFNNSGVRIWVTYFGNDNVAAPQDLDESLQKVIVAPNGKVYVAGTINTLGGILTDAGGHYDDSYNGGTDIFVARFSATGALEWSSYLGGTNNDGDIYGIAVDDSSNFYISGQTQSTDFPTVDPGNGAYFDNSLNGTVSGFISKFDDNTNLVWSTYIGNAGDDSHPTIDVNGDNLYYSEYTNGSSGMPTLDPADGSYFNSNASGTTNAFISIFTASTGAQTYGSYVNAGGDTKYYCIRAIDGNCNDQFFVTGTNSGTSYPVVDPGSSAYQATSTGGSDKFIITKFNQDIAPDASWTNPGTLCDGGIIFNMNTYVTGATGGTWSGHPSVTSGGLFDPTGLSGSVTLTYTVGTTCTSSESQSFTINAASVAGTSITSTLDSICPGTSVTLTVNGGSLGVGADWEWYSGNCGSNAVGTGTSITVSPAVPTTYFARAEGTCNTTACVSKLIHTSSESLPASQIIASADTVCIGDSTVLTPLNGSLGTSADWIWYETGCGADSIGSGSSLVVYPTVNKTYYVRAEGDCNTTFCQAVSITTMTNSVAPSSISAVDTIICSGSFTTLSINGGMLGDQASFQWYSGSCGGTPEGTGTSLVVSPTTTTTYYARAEGYCGNTTCTQITIQVNSAPVGASSIITPTTNVCSGESLTLTAFGGALNGAQWQWYSTACGGTPEGTGTAITVSPTGSLTYFVRAEGSCGTSSCTQISIIVHPSGDASWTNPGALCESLGTLDLTTLITGTTGGVFSGTGVTGNNFDPTGLSGQTIDITYAEGIPPCVDTVTHSINIVPTISASWSTPGNVCQSADPIDLNTLINGTAGGTWSGLGITGSTFDPTGLLGPINVTYDVGVAPCDDSQTLQINVINVPTMPTASVSDSLSCPGDLITVSGNGSGPGITYQVFADSLANSYLGNTDLDLNPTVTTTYYVFAVDGNNCFNTGGPAATTVTVNPLPFINITGTTSICEGQSTNLNVNSGISYIWNTGDTTGTITVSPLEDTLYVVTAIDANTCTASDSVTVTVTTQNDIEAIADSETTETEVPVTVNILNNDTGSDPNFVSITSDPSVGTYTLNNGVLEYISIAGFAGFDTLTYQICHPTCPNLCASAEVLILINVDVDVTPPTGFSPNGDGINDVFKIIGLEYYPQAELLVYNRWGEQVFNAQPYNNNWGGESNGKRTASGDRVPDGTYFYVIKLGDGFATINGHVEIKSK